MVDLQVQPGPAGKFPIDRTGSRRTIDIFSQLRIYSRQIIISSDHPSEEGEPEETVPPDGVSRSQIIPDDGWIIIQILPKICLHPDFVTGVKSGLARRQKILVFYGGIGLRVKNNRTRTEFTAGTES
jgi:hypothetical protein